MVNRYLQMIKDRQDIRMQNRIGESVDILWNVDKQRWEIWKDHTLKMETRVQQEAYGVLRYLNIELCLDLDGVLPREKEPRYDKENIDTNA